MKLDVKDRLILSNQYRILAKIDPENADGHRTAAEIFENGYELLYDQYTQHVERNPLSVELCQEVQEVLSMYDDLGYSFEQLSDKSKIDASSVKFPGFYANTETAQLGLARFLVDVEKRFARLAGSGDNLDSHAPLLDTYRRMLPVWKAIGRTKPFDKSVIQTILGEWTHPENRK